MYDGAVLLPSCDKNMPGALMAACRYNRPSVVIYGGSILPGIHKMDCPGLNVKKGDQSNITDTFEAYGAYINGKISDDERKSIIQNACPGSGRYAFNRENKKFNFINLTHQLWRYVYC